MLCGEELPGLVELAQDQDVPLVGVTEAPLEEASAYAYEGGYGFPILAGAGDVMDAWGVDFIWGNVVRLVDPDGQVVAVGVSDSAARLERR